MKREVLDKHMDYWESGVVGERDGMVLSVLVDKYDLQQHNLLVEYLNIFLMNYQGGWLQKLQVSSLDSHQGGFQFESSDKTLNLGAMWSQSMQQRTSFEDALTIRYGVQQRHQSKLNVKLNKYCTVGKFGNSEVSIVTFYGNALCPRRVMLELFLLFDSRKDGGRDYRSMLNCKVALVMETKGFPDEDDAIWSTRSLQM